MKPCALPVASVLAALTCAAHAQTQAAPGSSAGSDNTTVLHLSVNATVKVAPDQLVADLDAVATGTTPAEAQRAVNAMMAQAKPAATAVPAVAAAFRDYTVGYADEKKTRWTAQQTLELKSQDAQPLLDLVGRLQAAGLALVGLNWQVSDGRMDQARRDANELALKHLQADTEAAARTLGLQVDHLQNVTVDQQWIPYARGVSAHAAIFGSTVEPPNSTPVAQDVISSARAEVLLRPPSAGFRR